MGNPSSTETLPSDADDVLPSDAAVSLWSSNSPWRGARAPLNPQLATYLRLIQGAQTSGNSWETTINDALSQSDPASNAPPPLPSPTGQETSSPLPANYMLRVPSGKSVWDAPDAYQSPDDDTSSTYDPLYRQQLARAEAKLKPSVAMMFKYASQGQTPEQRAQLDRLMVDVDTPRLPVSGTVGQVLHAVTSPPTTFTDLVQTGRDIQQNNYETILAMREMARKHGVDPDIVAKLPPLWEQILRGTGNAVVDAALGLTSPVGLLTMGLGALPQGAQKMAAAGFGAHALSQLPDQVRAIATEESQPADQRNPQQLTEDYLGLLASLGFTGASGAHVFSPEAGEGAAGTVMRSETPGVGEVTPSQPDPMVASRNASLQALGVNVSLESKAPVGSFEAEEVRRKVPLAARSVSQPVDVPSPWSSITTQSLPASPNAFMRRNANSRGTYVRATDNMMVKATAVLDGDHIVSKKWIREQPGFNDLTQSQQDWILNHPLNTQGLPRTFNASKGARAAHEWTTYKDQPIDPEYIQNSILRGKMIKNFIRRQIDIFNQAKP